MSQTETQRTQSQSPLHNIRGCIRDDGAVHCDHGKARLLTSFTSRNPSRPFFTCRLQRENDNRCAFFMWLDVIREDVDWDENRFRAAYPQYRPPGDNLAATETPRKRRTSPGSLSGPSSPKRICHSQPEEDLLSDEEFFASPLTSTNMATTSQSHTTASRLNRAGTRSHPGWPLTPSSPRTREPQTNASPSRESVRRHETRVNAQLSHLQNFDGVADLSPLSMTPNIQASHATQLLPARAVGSADEVEDMLHTANNITIDYVRRLERRSIAGQKASDAKMVRIQQLEAELERSRREYERSQQRITKLNRENERFQREIIKLTDKLRNGENERLSRLHPA